MERKKYEFDAEIKKNPDLNSGFIEFPYDVKSEFGKGRVKVKALIDNVEYRGSLVKMGGACHWMGITQEIRKATGKNPGDTVHIIIEEDIEERVVDVPEDLLAILKNEEGMLDYFNKLAYTHRKEYARWIAEAKKEETRKSRLGKAVEMMKAGMAKKAGSLRINQTPPRPGQSLDKKH